MSARTDIHAPSTFAPGDYKAVAYGDLSIQRPGFPEWERLLREQFGSDLAETILRDVALVSADAQRDRLVARYWPSGEVPGTATGKINRCAHCGYPNLVRIVVAQHLPTEDFVPVGWDCAERLELPDLAAFARFRSKPKRRELQQTYLELSLRRRFPAQCAEIAERNPCWLLNRRPRALIRLVACYWRTSGESVPM